MGVGTLLEIVKFEFLQFISRAIDSLLVRKGEILKDGDLDINITSKIEKYSASADPLLRGFFLSVKEDLDGIFKLLANLDGFQIEQFRVVLGQYADTLKSIEKLDDESASDFYLDVTYHIRTDLKNYVCGRDELLNEEWELMSVLNESEDVGQEAVESTASCCLCAV